MRKLSESIIGDIIRRSKKTTDTVRKEDEKVVYYQPEVYNDDGTNISWNLPEELNSFDVFLSKEDCENWLEDNGYDLKDCNIEEYEEDDIEDVTILDANGEPIE